MQRRSIFSSLLLVSLLSTFSFATSFAQDAVNVESKSSLRCVTNTVDVSVDISQDVSGLEIVLDWSGDGTVTNVTFDAGLANLGLRGADWTSVPGQIRIYALDNTGGTDCLAAGTGIAVATIEYTTDDVCSGSLGFAGGTFNCPSTPVTASSQFVDCASGALVVATVNAGTVSVDNGAPAITCPADVTMHWGTSSFATATATDPDDANGCENLLYSLGAAPSYASIDPVSGVVTLSPLGGDVCEASVEVIITDKCGATDACTFNVCVQNTPPVAICPADLIRTCWGSVVTGDVDATDADNGPVSPSYSVIDWPGPGPAPTVDGNGVVTWNTEEDAAYIGTHTITVVVSDGAAICDPCSPSNSDTCSFDVLIVPNFRVEIAYVDSVIQGGSVDVPITLDGSYESYEMAGFDFLVQYDASALSITGASEGGMLLGNAWEYFTFRFGPNGNCGSGCPTGKFRVVALAETNDGMAHPSGFTNVSGGSDELAVLHFQVSNDRNLGCQQTAINFCWYDCGDNSISSVSGDSLFISRYVYAATKDNNFGDGGAASIHADGGFPSFTGAPLACDVSGGPGKPEPLRCPGIDFQNGAVRIICPEEIDDRGDVNLNGISNEIADAVVFTNYFIAGLNAFDISVEGQIAATEINGDGVPLTVADLVYLIRVIVGDALPLPKSVPGGGPVQFSTRGDAISSDVELGAAVFVFEGNVDVILHSVGMTIKTGLIDGNTHALVYSIDGNTAAAGEIVSSTGALISVEASDINGVLLSPGDMIVRPTEFAVYQNYPNPFNPSTKIKFDMFEAGQYTVTIYNVAGQKVKEFTGYAGNETVELEWDASSVASGIYFSSVKANGQIATKKMALLK